MVNIANVADIAKSSRIDEPVLRFFTMSRSLGNSGTFGNTAVRGAA
jgi:hypothetical protein